ncbi:hypothetical protein [Cupriavidus sp. HPC(L)]|uniref:hypothetical protein n=1 Tax=Cupriavidus sp. HPC(L) TaxID=1217418 RepID=UPI0020A1C77B|nr:hypothetical protein [Cupriavidus sp. HPC(L)]
MLKYPVFCAVELTFDCLAVMPGGIPFLHYLSVRRCHPMRIAIAVLFSAALLAGCASEVRERIASNYGRVGAAAIRQGDWDTARRAFARVTVNADLAELPAARRALAHYEYGRSLGVTCYFDRAEEELKTAFELDKQAGQPLYLSLVELARLNLDQGKYSQSAAYFERAIPLLEAAGVAKEAPMGYADILEEYARTLSGMGRTADAQLSVGRATTLRKGVPG